jgi:cell fate regulator YaaT (PSP1 superfamily)
MGCGSGGCSTGGCGSGGCSSGACNKLNTFDWLAEMDLPPHMKPFDIVEVRFKGTRKEFYKSTHIDFFVNEYVVVEAENGYDIGKVSLKGELVKLQLKKYNRSEHDTDFRKIMRKATEADVAKYKENQELEVPTMYKARSIAMELGLSMKLSDVEYQGDRRKATFFYTADERVDFRELIKRLAESFKVRIEMRQIGYRQEAGRLGAIGSCGRELCCSTWLTDFKLVNTSAARYQNLSLNPLKLSGQCGKLKCCLNYELESYVEALKDFPNENVVTLHFAEEKSFRSVKTDILKKLMWFAPQTELGGEWLSLPVTKVTEFMEMNRRGEKPTLEIQIKVPLKTEKVELEFKNDMGVGSLSRLDERDRNKKNQGRNKNNKTRSNNNAGNSNPVGNNPGASTSNNQTPRPNQGPRNNQGPRPNGPRPEGNNRPNNNAPRTEGNNPNNRPNTNNPQQGNAPRPEGNNNPNNRPNTNGPQQGNTPRPEGNNPNNRPPRRPNNNQNRNNRPNNNPNNNQSTNNNPTE